MTNTQHRATEHQPTRQHQTAAAIREVTFQRRVLGLEADKVYEYLDLLADQLQAAEEALTEARAESERLQAEVDEFEQAGERVNEQVVQMFSQAQLIAEEMVADVSRDARERIGQAREHERKIVEEAVSAAGQQVRSYAQSAQAQMHSIMESFATEVDQLGSPSVSRQATPPRPQPNGTSLGSGDFQIQVPNHRRPDSHGSD